MLILLFILLLLSSPAFAGVTFTYDGVLRDKVGKANIARADGQADNTLTVRYSGPARTILRLQLLDNQGGMWDTAGATGFWTLGAALTLDSALLNAPDDSVSLGVVDTSSFKIFAAQYQSTSTWTLYVTYADGATEIVNSGGSVAQPPSNPTDMNSSGPFMLSFDRDFVITFGPGKTFTTKQSKLPDGSTVLEFTVK